MAIQAFIWDRYNQPEQREVFNKATLENIESLPVRGSRGRDYCHSPTGEQSNVFQPFAVEGKPPQKPGEEPVGQFTIASATYFNAIGARLLQGRLFNQFDTKDTARVVLINNTMARRNWPGENPVGAKVTLKRGGRDVRGGTTWKSSAW